MDGLHGHNRSVVSAPEQIMIIGRYQVSLFIARARAGNFMAAISYRCPFCQCSELYRTRQRVRGWARLLGPFFVVIKCDVCGARFRRLRLRAWSLPVAD
jgi:hypothetical protein